MDVMINASPIIFLSKINRFHLLGEMFDKIYIPEAVMKEITDCTYDISVQKTVNDVISNEPFRVVSVQNKTAVASLLGKLHLGEVEVIVGAIELNIPLAILDDRYARSKAKQMDLAIIGTLGVLMQAKKLGYISDIANDIANLQEIGMYISSDILRSIL